MWWNIEQNFWEENNDKLLFQKEQKSDVVAMSFLYEEESIPVVKEYQKELDNLNEKTTEIVWKNILKTRRGEVLKEFVWDNFNKTVHIKWKKEGFSLNSISIETFNDNGIAIDWEIFWEDVGKTFWFNGTVDFNIWEHKYIVDWTLNHYTNWEIIVYNENGKRNWNNTDFSNSTRIDQIDIWIKKEVLNKNIEWDYYSAKLWIWLQAIWDFWGWDIQKEWHKLNEFYKHKAVYEDVSWATVDIRWDILMKKYILWDENIWTYVNWSADFKIAADNKYWESSIWWKIGIWIDSMWFNIEWWHHEKILNWPTASSTIQGSMLDNNHESWNYLKVSAPVPFIDWLDVEYKYQNNVWNDYMTVWVKYEF